MNSFKQIIKLFSKLGGNVCCPVEELAKRIHQVRGFIFDWDGVFHIGYKGDTHSGVFSESDSMGLNMLRYGCWCKYGDLPFMGIISGQKDKTASIFADREHLSVVYTSIRDKSEALEHACTVAGLKPGQMACMFDDINDLAMARHCGLRILVHRTASPLFMEYTAQKGDCDYITAHPAQAHAIREFAELFLGVSGIFPEVVESRINFDTQYQAYWQTRNCAETQYYTWRGGRIQRYDN